MVLDFQLPYFCFFFPSLSHLLPLIFSSSFVFALSFTILYPPLLLVLLLHKPDLSSHLSSVLLITDSPGNRPSVKSLTRKANLAARPRLSPPPSPLLELFWAMITPYLLASHLPGGMFHPLPNYISQDAGPWSKSCNQVGTKPSLDQDSTYRLFSTKGPVEGPFVFGMKENPDSISRTYQSILRCITAKVMYGTVLKS